MAVMDDRAGKFLQLCMDKYFDDPCLFAEEVCNFIPSDQQRVAMEAVAGNKSVAIKSGHGVGKSALESIICLWYMCTRPNSRIILTAPSARQLYDVLGAEIRLWYNKSIMLPLNLFEFTKDRIRMNVDSHRNTWFASMVSVSNPENVSGGHAEYILAIVDEGAGVDSEIFVRLEGILTTKGSKMITCGNPSFTSGYFYNIFNNEDYKKSYATFTFNCENSSNVDEEWVEYMKEKYGEDSPIYRVRVLGEFAPMNEMVIIDRKYVKPLFTDEQKAQAQTDPNHIYLGIDVASGEADDYSCISARSGNKEVFRQKYKEKLKSFYYICCEKIDHAEELYDNVTVNIDTTGLGHQLGQDLYDLYRNYENVTINTINFSDAPVDKNTYANIVTEMFFTFKEKMDNIYLIHSDELEEGLSARRYEFDMANRFKAEKKKEFIKRTEYSPDESDAVLLAFYEERCDNLYQGYVRNR